MNFQELLVYWRVIKKRLWLIALLVGTTAATIIGISLIQPAQYRASLRFQVTALPPTEVALFQATRSGVYRDEIAVTRANFIEVLTSLEVAWQTVDELKLPITGQELVRQVTVEQSSSSDFVRVSVTAKDPQLAADIANAIISVAIRRYGEVNARPLTQAREFINGQLEQTQRDLLQAQAGLISFKMENNIGTLDGAIDAQTALIRLLELSHDEALAEGNQQRAASYEELIAKRQLELQDIIQLSGEYSTLETHRRQVQDTYNFLLEKETEARLKENEALNLGFIQVLGQARVPSEAEPRLSLPMLSLSLVIAVVAGVMMAFLLEYLERMRLSRATASTPVVEGKAILVDAR